MNKLVLVIIFILCVLPPVIHNYQFPSYGDDSFHHLERMDTIEKEGIGTPAVRYYGPEFTWLLLKPFGGSDYAFIWFNWLAIAGCMGTMYLFGSKLTGSQPAGLAMMTAGALISPHFINLFHNGTIYNLINLYIFGLCALFCLLRWLENYRPYYFIVSMLLLAIMVVFHSSTTLVFYAGILLFLAIKALGFAHRKDMRQLGGVTLFGLVALGVLGLFYSLNPELSRLLSTATATVTSMDGISGAVVLNQPSMGQQEHVFLNSWMFRHFSPWLGVLAMVSGLILYYRHRNNKVKQIGNNWSCNRNLVLALGSLCLVLALGAFTDLFYDSMRFSMDLSIILSMLVAYLIVLGWQARKSRLYTSAISAILLLCALPAIGWFLSYHNAMSRADLAAVQYLNETGAKTYTTSSQVQHRIYDRFIEAEFSYPDAEYVIYRQPYQTVSRDPESMWFTHAPVYHTKESKLSDYAGMEEVGRWTHGHVEVIVFKDNSYE